MRFILQLIPIIFFCVKITCKFSKISNLNRIFFLISENSKISHIYLSWTTTEPIFSEKKSFWIISIINRLQCSTCKTSAGFMQNSLVKTLFNGNPPYFFFSKRRPLLECIFEIKFSKSQTGIGFFSACFEQIDLLETIIGNSL